MKKFLTLALVTGMGFFALTLAAVPEKPNGKDPPPDDKRDEESTGGTSDTCVLTGVLCLGSGSETYAGGALESTASDESVILATNGATLAISNYTLTKSGDCTSEDNSNFFAVNAVVAAKSGAKICIDNSTVDSNANGANCLFASGDGSTIYAYRCAIASTKDSSRGLDATYEGKVIASKLSIDTTGDHCAALATDRGDGSISVTDSTLNTAGQGSPLIYSTGVIEVNGVTGTATGAQIAGIEGLSAIRIWNSDLTGSAEKASESVPNGVLIYQSMSGDSTEGTATFEVSASSLKSTVSGGAMFYITNSKADIRVQDTDLEFDSTNNYLILAAGNDGTHGWGNVGSNGAEVVFTAIDQTLVGNISVDGISSVDLYLTNSTYTGAIAKDATYAGDGGASVYISADSTWIVTSNCTLKSLTVAPGVTNVVDAGSNRVSIVSTSDEPLVAGTSEFKITVSDYVLENAAITNAISDFTIGRSDFDATYRYYFKPHPPENAIVKVKYGDTILLPDMDHKYWVDTLGITVTIIYATETGYFFADGASTMSREVTFDTDKMDIYPLDGTVVVKAQAQSGSSYYPTLREAVDTVKARSRITLNDNVTLAETLTVTNSITLDLATNVVTLGSALTNAFCFTAGATVSNGTIASSLAANVEGSTLMRFTDCKATLKDLVIDGSGYETVVAHDSAADTEEKYANAKHTLDTLTCDGLAITGNGCLLAVDYANATLTNNCSIVTNGTFASFGGTHAAAVCCLGNGAVTIADGTYAAPQVLQSGDLGGKITVNGGAFSGRIYSRMTLGAHTNLEPYANYKAQFALNAGAYDDAVIAFADADSRSLDAFTKGEDVAIEVPAGYAWENNVLVGEAIVPGELSDTYADALSATNAAAKINADKVSSIGIPTGVESSAKATYLSKIAALVTGENCVVVDLTAAAEDEVQGAIDAAVTNETAVAALTGTNASAKVTIAVTTPGLYYWIDGGTDVGAITNAGAGVLSTNGGSLELSKPTLDATKNQAFFRIAAGVSAPVQSNND